MKLLTFIGVLAVSLAACTQADSQGEGNSPRWQSGTDIEAFWEDYAESRGGLTWGRSDEYPPYSEVNEGDTFLVELEQGVCLMEFFHNRWRRANDVRRWDESVNEYGGCPYVFD